MKFIIQYVWKAIASISESTANISGGRTPELNLVPNGSPN